MMEANKKSYPGGFERVQEHENGIALDEHGRPFLDVLADWNIVLGYVATDCKDFEPYTQFYQDLRALSLEAQIALDAIVKLLKKRKSLWPAEYANKTEGAAYPLEIATGQYNSGLTKREEIAARALQGMLADPNNSKQFQVIADEAVRAADALIERLSADPVAEGLNLLPMYSGELDEGLTDDY
jgi:hypothetical protein